jgi:hypothetical protein
MAAAILVLQSVTAAAGCFTALYFVIGILIIGFSGRLSDDLFLFIDLGVMAAYPVAIGTALLIRGLLRLSHEARTVTFIWCGLFLPFSLWMIVGIPDVFPSALAKAAPYFLGPVAVAAPLCVVALLVGGEQRLLYPKPPPQWGPLPARTRSRARRWMLGSAVTLPFLVALVFLTMAALPHEPTLSDLEHSPEGELHYPGAVAESVSGSGYVRGGIDAPPSPARLSIDFSETASKTAILSWYRERLILLGYRYFGCFNEIGRDSTVVPGYFLFGRGSTSEISIAFDDSGRSFTMNMVRGPDQDAAQDAARSRLGTC